MVNQELDPDITAVCCIEYGRLEEQTLLMVRSLREFGGRLANIPIIAVVGREGPSLRQATRDDLAKLGVEIVHANVDDNPATWLNYMNKIAAVCTAERIADSSQIVWIDSDIFFLEEPKSLMLDAGEDFGACTNALPPTVIEGDHTFVAYWDRLCDLLGTEFTSIPWILRDDGFGSRKVNFSSGIFTWRKGSGFPSWYQKAVRTLLDSRIATPGGMFFMADQVVFAPILAREKVQWKDFDTEDHFIVLGSLLKDGPMKAPHFGRARVLHYSNSFSTEFVSSMEKRLREERPELLQWLKVQRETLVIEGGGPWRVLHASLLRAWRGAKYRNYARKARTVLSY